MILLSDSHELGPAFDADLVAAVPLVIPEEIVDVPELKEIRPSMEV